MRIFIFIFLMTTTAVYSQSEPKEVVQFALQSLTNGDVEKLLDVTENSELRQVKELIAMMGGSIRKKDSILQQYRNLKSWKIENVAEHSVNGRKIAVVNTKWKVTIPLEQDPKNFSSKNLQEKNLKVDYMLEQFNGKWKIISRKAQN